MNPKLSVRFTASLVAFAVSMLLASCGSAQEDDRARFRGGVALEGGAIIVPDVATVGTVGAQGQIGVQINNLVGVYAVPAMGAVVGEVGGIYVGSALIVDFTFNDMFTVGAGPDVGAFAA